ncbi:MAG: helix-turn-helix domain-containing protein [Bacteroidota bacterium]
MYYYIHPMNIGHVKFIQPNHPILRKWIKGYYVHQSEDQNFHTKLTFYQNITTTISIYKDSITTSDGRYRKQTYEAGEGYSKLLAGLVDKYQEVEFVGPLDRLAIVFYPLGLNHFMNQPLGNYLQTHYSFFDYFDEDFQIFLPQVYAEPDLETKRELLDQFFLQHYQELHEPVLLNAVEILTTEDSEIKVNVLAERLGVSRRTLLRKFKKHLAYSIEEYISVIKFRKALYTFQNNPQNPSMSYIAMESNYYDQPDFNHQIRSRTQLTPKELFEQLKIVDDTLFWKI